MENIIEAHSLMKIFAGRTALEDVSFTVKKGEIFGFLGPSGAGKTTTIKILTGQSSPTNGRALVFGIPPGRLGEKGFRKKLGVLTDNSGLYKRLSVYDNLSLYCRLYDVPIREINRALTAVNLQGERKKAASKLSKGMLQRVTLARAFLHKPELLFLDEPTSSLDPVNSKQIHDCLRRLNSDGTTIFLTTHDMGEAESLCDRVAFLNKGRINLLDEPRALRRRFSDRGVTVELTDGSRITVRNDPQGAKELYAHMSAGAVAAVHTNEPTLGDIFVEVTGRGLA